MRGASVVRSAVAETPPVSRQAGRGPPPCVGHGASPRGDARESTREPFRLAPTLLLLLVMATRHLNERVAGDVVLMDPENRAANRPLRGERCRGRWTLRGVSALGDARGSALARRNFL